MSNTDQTPAQQQQLVTYTMSPGLKGLLHKFDLSAANGAPAYVTAVSKSNTIDGWCDRRADGGVLIEVKTKKAVCGRLSVPHAKRILKDKVWLLNSGESKLGDFDPKAPEQGFCPGFLRGLALADNYADNHAFVGLSKPRYQRFAGVGLGQKLKDADSEPGWGLQIIDMDKKNVAAWFWIDGVVSGVYDLALLKGAVCTMLLGFALNELHLLVTH